MLGFGSIGEFSISDIELGAVAPVPPVVVELGGDGFPDKRKRGKDYWKKQLENKEEFEGKLNKIFERFGLLESQEKEEFVQIIEKVSAEPPKKTEEFRIPQLDYSKLLANIESLERLMILYEDIEEQEMLLALLMVMDA